MKFNELLNASGINIIDRGGSQDPAVSDIVYDSRRVKPGAVYVAIPGMKVHGGEFIEQAIKNGAAAVISEKCLKEISVPWAAVSQIRTAAAILGRTLWSIDLSGLTSVGITGTNGKTTVSYLFKTLFDKHVGEEYSWMFGTAGNRLGLKDIDAAHTTPESVDIFRHISDSRAKPRGLAMEVSSHALALDRVAAMKYDVALWTNLTQEHLDFHGSMEEYYMAKKLLFTNYMKPGGTAVINVDDEYGRRLAGELRPEKKLLTYGKSDGADVRIVSWKCDWNGTSVVVSHNGIELNFSSALFGFFNVYNMVSMISGAFALGIDVETVKKALANTRTVPGRMDKVETGAPFTVIVDYAHTPDALVNVLKTSGELTGKRLICVFGCGGDRDRGKRPLMAKAVAENCDMAVITSDNPRSEKPEAIINDILNGIPLDFPYKVVADRREAIKCALRDAREGDCVVIAGKGHETYQEVGGVRHQFDDKEETVRLYKDMEKNDAA
ncbi:MAG: UDP-N-acetylmuramoyl-L-alanyl-D-glutamate--2,6-diaminopimelate ligase [Chitinispirillales bacterium]|jgi:UDP-N-acetylmuramoyl-L-alanyl-D-glutamate--2,6-diaminopimelate ligase|nr:UDP-N-acetylmuramoyl-L-alanyl-D-glutamate--2,6-diaminopimelate ligase [Chitinispirillales bacterium]